MRINEIVDFDTKSKIQTWLDNHDIKDYKITDDGIVNVDGNVHLDFHNQKLIPIQFGSVQGNFRIEFQVTDTNVSLKGCPHFVGGHFSCRQSTLNNLQFGPSDVAGEYNCSINPINSFEFLPNSAKTFICVNIDVIDPYQYRFLLYKKIGQVVTRYERINSIFDRYLGDKSKITTAINELKRLSSK